MGREYARLAGEDPRVAEAVYEHYLPVAAGGDLPVTDEGAIVGIADKLDSICGFFGVNLIPTGTADPYALRRQCLGIIHVILNKAYPLNLETLVDAAIAIYGNRLPRPCGDIKADVLEFFRARFENLLISQGASYDAVDAVTAAGITDLVRCRERLQALEIFKKDPDYEPLAIACKRAGNILKDTATLAPPDPAVFVQDQEKTLYQVLTTIRQTAVQHLERKEDLAALREMAKLRAPVDAFFGAVMVMDPDETLRRNRLALLQQIRALVSRVADFSRLVTEAA
jgi:glycyl-tRNA synthetase beta chain